MSFSMSGTAVSIEVDIVPAATGTASTVAMEVCEGHTAASLVAELMDTGLPKRGAWHLYEKWKNCRRRVGSSESILGLHDSWGGVGQPPRPCLEFRQTEHTKRSNSKKKEAKRSKMRKELLADPKLFLKKCSKKRLSCTRSVVEVALRRSKRKYSNLLLTRIVNREPLWGPLEATPLDSLQADLNTKKNSNLKLASEVADLNIRSTRLRDTIHPLRQREQELTRSLVALQDEAVTKRNEKERRGPRDLTDVQTDIIKLQRELEIRNRLNASHTSRLKEQKIILTEKKKFLAERKQELEALRNRRFPTPVKPLTVNQEEFLETSEETHSQKDIIQPTIEPSTPSGSPSKSNTKASSVSKKRHTSIFEAKTKKLVEEEGISFRTMHSQQREDTSLDEFVSTDLKEYSKAAIDIHTEGPDVLVIPKVDEMWYKNSQDPPVRDLVSVNYESKLSKPRKTSPSWEKEQLPEVKEKTSNLVKKVRFSTESLILSASLEGELEIVKNCVKELGGCSQASDKGATCLHNAVCSGNLELVEFLVEMGCEINAQDIDGWTPLHCAAAYSNLDMIHYLVENGTSLFLTTQDGDTPTQIALEECEGQPRPTGTTDENSSTTANKCWKYLSDTESNLGVVNGGKVFTLFSRQTMLPDELSINEGEQLVIIDRGDEGDKWWSAQNNKRQTGLVPCTFLGSYPRHSIFL